MLSPVLSVKKNGLVWRSACLSSVFFRDPTCLFVFGVRESVWRLYFLMKSISVSAMLRPCIRSLKSPSVSQSPQSELVLYPCCMYPALLLSRLGLIEFSQANDSILKTVPVANKATKNYFTIWCQPSWTWFDLLIWLQSLLRNSHLNYLSLVGL